MTTLRLLIALASLVVVFAACLPPLTGTKTSGLPEATPAFPGAEGFGKYTSGGRGGKVWIVTTLNDSGPGSLREAIAASGARIIVFATSGTIKLASPLRIKNGDVTLAGQTAPGDGICIRDYPLINEADNAIIRYMRFRLGDESRQENDAMTGLRHKNIIVDHCSISWGTDECASFYDNENLTMQWCIISESLNESVHQEGAHGYGGIWGGKGASFHHNLFAHHTSRNPRFCGSRYHKQPEKELVDFRNNVIYNWKNNSSYAGERGNHNMVGNYYKPGPATVPSVASRIVNPFQPYGRFYVAGNYMEGDPSVTNDNWRGVACEHVDSVKADRPFDTPALTEQPPGEVFDLVLRHAGASLKRDAVDERIVNEVRSGTATFGKKGIIDSQKEVGGWPELKTLPPPADKDRDGMPDSWEKKMKLDTTRDDAAGFDLSDMYTNIEIYMNSIVK